MEKGEIKGIRLVSFSGMKLGYVRLPWNWSGGSALLRLRDDSSAHFQSQIREERSKKSKVSLLERDFTPARSGHFLIPSGKINNFFLLFKDF